MPANVAQFGYGSEVDGWLTEQKVINQDSLVRIPEGLSYEQASTLPCAGLTAWSALTPGTPIRAGHAVLTQGTGGVSIFALQLAKAVGARVIATTSTAAKADRLRSMGADEIINYRDEVHWGDRVRELTGSLGVDRVVKVGGPGTISESLRAVALGGEIASVGFLSPDQSTTGMDFFSLFASGATFRHISVGSRQGLQDVTRTIVMAGITPVIDRFFEFVEAQSAYAHLESGAHFGKVVIKCSESAAGL